MKVREVMLLQADMYISEISERKVKVRADCKNHIEELIEIRAFHNFTILKIYMV